MLNLVRKIRRINLNIVKELKEREGAQWRWEMSIHRMERRVYLHVGPDE